MFAACVHHRRRRSVARAALGDSAPDIVSRLLSPTTLGSSRWAILRASHDCPVSAWRSCWARSSGTFVGPSWSMALGIAAFLGRIYVDFLRAPGLRAGAGKLLLLSQSASSDAFQAGLLALGDLLSAPTWRESRARCFPCHGGRPEAAKAIASLSRRSSPNLLAPALRRRCRPGQSATRCEGSRPGFSVIGRKLWSCWLVTSRSISPMFRAWILLPFRPRYF